MILKPHTFLTVVDKTSVHRQVLYVVAICVRSFEFNTGDFSFVVTQNIYEKAVWYVVRRTTSPDGPRYLNIYPLQVLYGVVRPLVWPWLKEHFVRLYNKNPSLIVGDLLFWKSLYETYIFINIRINTCMLYLLLPVLCGKAAIRGPWPIYHNKIFTY